MPNAHLIDFAASRRLRTRIAANVKAALGEAEQIHEAADVAIKRAHLAALSGIAADEFIFGAQLAVERLAKQLTFAAALAERARSARCA